MWNRGILVSCLAYCLWWPTAAIAQEFFPDDPLWKEPPPKPVMVAGFRAPHGALAVSARTGEGLEILRKAILSAAGWSATGESVFLARERHVRALNDAHRHLEDARRQIAHWELFAEELRLAHGALISITGEFTADDLLGEIFSRFCIGK